MEQSIAMQQMGMLPAQIEDMCYRQTALPTMPATPSGPQTFGASNICVSVAGACQIYQFGPVGAPCWCNTVYGPANGVLR